jgi:hypothetical protein
MLQTLDAADRDRWTDTRAVTSVEGRVVDGIAIVEITGRGAVDRDAFEMTHRIILPPGTPWFIAELVRVRNPGDAPLRLRGLFFRVYSDFKVAPKLTPPNVWDAPLADCWLDAEEGRFFGVAAPKLSPFRIQFYYNERSNSMHPDARLEVERVKLAPGETFVPSDATYVLCAVGRGGTDGWLKAADAMDAATK